MKVMVLRGFKRSLLDSEYLFETGKVYEVIPYEDCVFVKHPDGCLAMVDRKDVDKALEVIGEEEINWYARGNDCDACANDYCAGGISRCRRYDECRPCLFEKLKEEK